MRSKAIGNLRRKKNYSKPEAKRVPLVPEEAVLGGCKVSSNGTGPGNTKPQYGCTILGVQCNTIGIS